MHCIPAKNNQINNAKLYWDKLILKKVNIVSTTFSKVLNFNKVFVLNQLF